MKITVAGLGYVGLSIAVLLAQKNEVTAIDISEDRVNKVNNKISPIDDAEIIDFLANKELNLKATLDPEEAYKENQYLNELREKEELEKAKKVEEKEVLAGKPKKGKHF